MNKHKLLIVISLISIAVFIFPIDVYAHGKCKQPICPSETELLSKLSATYTITFRSIRDRTKILTSVPKRYISFTKDPDVTNGVKYDISGIDATTGDSIFRFSDGKGVIDHDLIYFNYPGYDKRNGEIDSLGCFGTILLGDSRILGTCIVIDGLDATGLHFSAKPTSKFSIFGENIKRDNTCVSEECPGKFELYDYLKSSYIFSANLVKGRTEQFRIDFDRYPTNKSSFKYNVFDANTNSLVFSSGGLGIYRRVYFFLPITVSGTLSTYTCNGVINPSTSIISGECKTINYNTTGLIAGFDGDFTAIPIGK